MWSLWGSMVFKAVGTCPSSSCSPPTAMHRKRILTISTKWNSVRKTLKVWAGQQSWWESVWFDSLCRVQICRIRIWLQCEPHTTAGCQELVSFWAVQAGVPVVLSMVVEKSCRKWFLPGSKRNCSGLSVLSFVRLWAKIQLEVVAGEAAGSNLTLKDTKLQSCRVITD